MRARTACDIWRRSGAGGGVGKGRVGEIRLLGTLRERCARWDGVISTCGAAIVRRCGCSSAVLASKSDGLITGL